MATKPVSQRGIGVCDVTGMAEIGPPTVPALGVELSIKAEGKIRDVGQLWPGGGELSLRNRAARRLHLSGRRRACTMLQRLLCASPPARPHTFHV